MRSRRRTIPPRISWATELRHLRERASARGRIAPTAKHAAHSCCMVGEAGEVAREGAFHRRQHCWTPLRSDITLSLDMLQRKLDDHHGAKAVERATSQRRVCAAAGRLPRMKTRLGIAYAHKEILGPTCM